MFPSCKQVTIFPVLFNVVDKSVTKPYVLILIKVNAHQGTFVVHKIHDWLLLIILMKKVLLIALIPQPEPLITFLHSRYKDWGKGKEDTFEVKLCHACWWILACTILMKTLFDVEINLR